VSSSVVLVRHGETEWSASGRHTSRTDVPLIETGRSQAVSIGGRLAGRAFGLVLTSPRARSIETCALAGFAERATADEDLREWDYGDYEGRTTPEIRAGRPGWSLWVDGCPGGETAEDVAARADRVIGRCRGARGEALLFGHGHMLRVFAARWLGAAPRAGAGLLLSTGAVCVLGWEREVPVLALWNDTSHLGGGAITYL